MTHMNGCCLPSSLYYVPTWYYSNWVQTALNFYAVCTSLALLRYKCFFADACFHVPESFRLSQMNLEESFTPVRSRYGQKPTWWLGEAQQVGIPDAI